MLLKDVAIIQSGKNASRLSDTELNNQYTSDDAVSDFHNMNKEINQSTNILTFDLYPKNGKYGSRVISKRNVSKVVLNQKMCKLLVDGSKASPYYLCYLLNENTDVQRQKQLFTQGSFVEKLSPSFLKDLQIPFPSLQEQKYVGKMYVKAIYQNYVDKKYADQKLRCIKSLLERKVGKTL